MSLGRNALVTGANRGIGPQVCRQLAARALGALGRAGRREGPRGRNRESGAGRSRWNTTWGATSPPPTSSPGWGLWTSLSTTRVFTSEPRYGRG